MSRIIEEDVADHRRRCEEQLKDHCKRCGGLLKEMRTLREDH